MYIDDLTHEQIIAFLNKVAHFPGVLYSKGQTPRSCMEKYAEQLYKILKADRKQPDLF